MHSVDGSLCIVRLLMWIVDSLLRIVESTMQLEHSTIRFPKTGRIGPKSTLNHQKRRLPRALTTLSYADVTFCHAVSSQSIGRWMTSLASVSLTRCRDGLKYLNPFTHAGHGKPDQRDSSRIL